MNKIINTTNTEETQKLGEQVGRHMLTKKREKQAKILYLYGDLGSGKTTFVQGLAKGLGIAHRIISPTFVIVRTYRITNQEATSKHFYHIDLYRVHSFHDVEGLGMKEIMQDPDNIVAIEWPEKLGGLSPKEHIDITFQYDAEDTRSIRIPASLLH